MQCPFSIVRVNVNGKIQFINILYKVKYKWAHQTRNIREGKGEYSVVHNNKNSYNELKMRIE